MRVLIAVPGLSFNTFKASKFLNGGSELLDPVEFAPAGSTLDVFPAEMKGLSPPGFWGIGIPHWPMEQTLTNGVAGPGQPTEELFVPEAIKEDMEELAGSYDKWRPYPATGPISEYEKKIARKFSTKRGKFFEHIFRYVQWETLFWVEHAPASLAHMDQEAALENSERILGKALRVVRRKPDVTFVYFSPYGMGSDPGFVVSNRLDAARLANWESIRSYLNGAIDSNRDGSAGP